MVISGFEKYEIFEDGKVISYQRIVPRVLKPYIAGNGYYEVALTNADKKVVRCGLHRLLAQHFIPNPNNLTQVNHKDGDTLNYDLENLEWISASDNCKHARYDLRKGNSKSIIVDGVEFVTLKQCAEHYNISHKNLADQLRKGIIPRALRGKDVIIK